MPGDEPAEWSLRHIAQLRAPLGMLSSLAAPGQRDLTLQRCTLQSPKGNLLDAAEAAEVVGADGATATGYHDLIATAVDWDVDDQYLEVVQVCSRNPRGLLAAA